MEMAQISVIIPVYQVEAFLHRCVDSVLCQSFQDFELILVDDGSPDRCGSICDEYAAKDSRIHVIHQKNGGLSAARNAGIDWVFANSSSQWLTFIDSDDWVHPDFLQILMDAVVEYGCKLGACGFFRTSGEGFPEENDFRGESFSADDYYCGLASEDSPAPACGKLYHRSLFQTLRYPVGKLHEDEFTTYRAVYDAGKVAVVTKKMYAYFQNPASITQSRWKPGRLDGLQALQEQMDFAREKQNERLLHRATDSFVWSIGHQLQQLSDQGNLNEREQESLKMLRMRLKKILKEGMNGREYPFNRENLLLYEEVYPVKPLWKAMHGVYGLVKKIRG